VSATKGSGCLYLLDLFRADATYEFRVSRCGALQSPLWTRAEVNVDRFPLPWHLASEDGLFPAHAGAYVVIDADYNHGRAIGEGDSVTYIERFVTLNCGEDRSALGVVQLAVSTLAGAARW
jgi:hypothetical protein